MWITCKHLRDQYRLRKHRLRKHRLRKHRLRKHRLRKHRLRITGHYHRHHFMFYTIQYFHFQSKFMKTNIVVNYIKNPPPS